jgi:hypothetical protein
MEEFKVVDAEGMPVEILDKVAYASYGVKISTGVVMRMTDKSAVIHQLTSSGLGDVGICKQSGYFAIIGKYNLED